MAKIIVQNTQITVIKQNEDDYISLTDMLKAKDGESAQSQYNWVPWNMGGVDEPKF